MFILALNRGKVALSNQYGVDLEFSRVKVRNF
jgi:hypothetical protein